MKYCAGLIGAGQISAMHVAALRRAGVEIVGICDVDASRSEAAAARFAIPAFSCPEDLAAAGANVMHVLTPPATHCEVALQALDQGCHVLVEKPLAVDVDDCRRIEQKAEARGLRVCVNHSLLFDPQVRRALEAVRSGKLGRIVSVDILRSSVYPAYPGGALPPHYRSAAYPFRDLGVHALYLFEAFLGPIEAVQADWKSIGGDPNLAFDEWRAQVHCRDGLGQFQLSWNVRPIQSQIIIQGTKGVMRVDLFLLFDAIRKSTRLPKAAERLVNGLTDSIRPLVLMPRGISGYLRGKVLPYHGLQDLVKEFYRSLANCSPPPVSVAEGTRMVWWTEHVARAADKDHQRRTAGFTLSDRVPVLVTGASGGLGSEIVKALVSRGQRVRMMLRRAPESVADGVEVALGNLGDPAAVDRAVRGAEVVIHAGAAMKGGAIDHCATIEGTRNVIDACLRHGSRQLIHISSMSVVDWAGAGPGEPITQNSADEPRPQDRGDYTRAKLEAERLIRRAVCEHQLPAVVLRPGQIFGGRIPLLTPAVARRMGKRWIVLGDGKLQLPLVHIDDVVDAVVAALDKKLCHGEVIQLVDDESPSQNQVLRELLGPSARIVRVPRQMVFMLGGLSELLLRPLRRKSPLSVYRLKSALARRTFRSENAATLLAWRPRVGVATGIANAAETMREDHAAVVTSSSTGAATSASSTLWPSSAVSSPT